MSTEHTKLYAELVAAGFSSEFLAEIVNRHGPEFLELLKKALVLGFTKEVITDLLTFAGKVAFDVIVSVTGFKSLTRSSGEEEEDLNSVVSGVLAKYRGE